MSIVPLQAAKDRRRSPASTANFGSGRRESHGASAFYERFVAPEISADSDIDPSTASDVIYNRDARRMTGVASDSVALVVTSPPASPASSTRRVWASTGSRPPSGRVPGGK